jgi:hypothetical protein
MNQLFYPPLLAGIWVGQQVAPAHWHGIGVLCYFGAAWLVYLIALDNPFIPARRPGYALAMGLGAVWRTVHGQH